jgi:ABC-type multidrug transport system fused ATPase/permease subunit
MKWFDNIFDNRKLMRDIILGVVIGIPIVLFIFYFGILDNIEITKFRISLATVSFIAVIYFFGLQAIKENIRARSKEDYEEKDEDTKANIEKLEAIKINERDVKQGYEFVKQLNIDVQHMANVKFTETKVKKLRKKRNKLIVKNKEIDLSEELLKEIEKLETTPLIPNWWNRKYIIKEYTYNSITKSYYDDADITIVEDGNSVISKPIKRGRFISSIFGIVRSLFMASAGLGILFTENAWVILTVIVSFLISAAISILWNYWRNTIYMATKNKKALGKRLNRKTQMYDYIQKDKPPVPTEAEKKVIQDKQDEIEQKDNDEKIRLQAIEDKKVEREQAIEDLESERAHLERMATIQSKIEVAKAQAPQKLDIVVKTEEKK